jgi:hypothetical protein
VIHLNQDQSGGMKSQNTGGPGQGRGGTLPENDHAVAFQTEKLKAKHSGQGKVTASIYVKGLGQKGDPTAEYRAAAEALEKAAEDALDDTDIPLERRNLLRDYFDHLRPEPAAGAAAGGEKK